MNNQFYNSHDLARLSGRAESTADHRSPFQVDRDRVLHTPAFRRLQSKTQVFWSGEYDFYRTRLTHSLEVAQIGRSICHYLLHHDSKSNNANDLRPDHFIDPDLVEAACLSHDLGHPPFGHAGETVLNHLMADYGGFEGNAQTLRLLAQRIFSQSNSGMDPTRAFLDSILKYKSLFSELKTLLGKNPKNHFVYDGQVKFLDWVLDGHDFPAELSPGDERDSSKSIECQIMDWADDTAYSLNDLADSTRAGFLTESSIRQWAEKNNHPTDDDSPLGKLIGAVNRDSVERLVGSRIGKFVEATTLHADTNFLSGTSKRYQYKLHIDPAAQSHQYIAGEKYLGQSFNLLPEQEASEIQAAESPAEKARLLCDYLAAHTDTSAVRLYTRLFQPNQGSISDLIS